MTKLQGLSGPAFDKAYIDAMVADHKEDDKDFKSEETGAKDPQVKRRRYSGRARHRAASADGPTDPADDEEELIGRRADRGSGGETRRFLRLEQQTKSSRALQSTCSFAAHSAPGTFAQRVQRRKKVRDQHPSQRQPQHPSNPRRYTPNQSHTNIVSITP